MRGVGYELGRLSGLVCKARATKWRLARWLVLAQSPLDAGKWLRESACKLKGEMKSEERLDLKLNLSEGL